MMHKQYSVLAVEHPLEKRLFAVFFALLAILFLAYLYFVASSVMNIQPLLLRNLVDAPSDS